MKRIAEQVGLEAPGLEMAPDLESLHASLARANLMRLRGDYAEAEQLCLQVLNSDPENAAAHILLGDIAFAQHRTRQAAEHYELAQSIDPAAPDVAQKLETARAWRQTEELNSAAEQLGLPTPKSLRWQTPIAVAGCVCALLVGIALIWRARQHPGNGATSTTISATPDTIANRPKSNVKTDGSGLVDDSASPSAQVPSGTGSNPPANPAGTTGDRGLAQVISQQSTVGSHLLAVIQDPRAKGLTLTFSVGAGEDPRLIGADLAKVALQHAADAQQVTLRSLRAGELIYMADVSRSRYEETLTESWQHANTGDDAWAGYCLANEWPNRAGETGSGPVIDAAAPGQSLGLPSGVSSSGAGNLGSEKSATATTGTDPKTP